MTTILARPARQWLIFGGLLGALLVVAGAGVLAYVHVLAYILQQNTFPSGPLDLKPAADVLKNIRITSTKPSSGTGGSGFSWCAPAHSADRADA